MAILFVEQLTVIDASYFCPQRGLVGESWIVDLELEGSLDAQSMVLDFGEVKKQLKRAIDAGPDHTLIIPQDYPGQVSRKLEDGRIHTLFASAVGSFEHLAPAEAVTLLPAAEVSIAALQTHLCTLLQHRVPSNVARVGVSLRHEAIEGAHYHYTHGLAKHLGNCQRIAHGHRSKLIIEVNGQRDPALEATWALRWRDIYLLTGSHIVEDNGERLRLAYTAPEGHFELELPSARCYRVGDHTDTTVEEIAQHLAHEIARTRPGNSVRVRAYEGVQKGAMASGEH